MTPGAAQGLERRIGAGVVRLVRGDITEQDTDGIVYYAQHDLTLGSGIGGAIAVRGGASVQKELAGLGPVQTGEAVVTGAGKLRAGCIIHAVGPRFQEEDTEAKLGSTVEAALARAREKGLRRVAFPAMGAGYYGLAAELSARVMVDSFRRHLSNESGIEEIVVCVLDTPQLEAFRAALAAFP